MGLDSGIEDLCNLHPCTNRETRRKEDRGEAIKQWPGLMEICVPDRDGVHVGLVPLTCTDARDGYASRNEQIHKHGKIHLSPPFKERLYALIIPQI